MRTREKLTLEEKFALALELIKRDRSLDEIRRHYRVSHTTAYKIRKTFLDGGRAALEAERQRRPKRDLEARVAALEDRLDVPSPGHDGNGRLPARRSGGANRAVDALDRQMEK
jgi:transposase-like protein